MKYNFDEIIDRRGTNAMNTDGFREYIFKATKDMTFPYKDEEFVRMWVADMDFSCPKEVIEAVQQRATHGIYGYTSEDAVIAFKKAAAGWFERHYFFSTEIDRMIFIPGIVPAVNSAIQEFTNIGDGVIVQQPVYYPFSDAVLNCERKIRINQLKEKDGYYTIDFENLEKLAQEKNTKLIILCNPHNPVGRVWSKSELLQIMGICHKNNVIVFSDEIHADFIMEGNQFISAGSLPFEFHDKLILAFAPSKTFNIAGLGASLIIVPDEKIKNSL